MIYCGKMSAICPSGNSLQYIHRVWRYTKHVIWLQFQFQFHNKQNLNLDRIPTFCPDSYTTNTRWILHTQRWSTLKCPRCKHVLYTRGKMGKLGRMTQLTGVKGCFLRGESSVLMFNVIMISLSQSDFSHPPSLSRAYKQICPRR